MSVKAWARRIKWRAWWSTLGTGVCHHAVALGAMSEALGARWSVENPSHPERARVVRRMAREIAVVTPAPKGVSLPDGFEL